MENSMSKCRHQFVQNQSQVKVLSLTQNRVKPGLIGLILSLATVSYFFSFWMNLLWRALTGD
jgi:hypothetical protein